MLTSFNNIMTNLTSFKFRPHLQPPPPPTKNTLHISFWKYWNYMFPSFGNIYMHTYNLPCAFLHPPHHTFPSWPPHLNINLIQQHIDKPYFIEIPLHIFNSPYHPPRTHFITHFGSIEIFTHRLQIYIYVYKYIISLWSAQYHYTLWILSVKLMKSSRTTPPLPWSQSQLSASPFAPPTITT